MVDSDGYGPYKPVPPPKPLPQQPSGSQRQVQPESLTPPPYRMPPYPLYNEPSIPGATGIETPIASPSPASTQNLHTHSNKFPIEREVILSSADKNCKIPILNDYKKRSKGVVAPDIPQKQMAAWTQQGNSHQVLSPDQTHPGPTQSNHASDSASALYRATYHAPQDIYGKTPLSTGAVPRAYHGPDPTKPTPRHVDDYSVQIETSKDSNPKETPKSSKSMTKTYHTIKDIISSKFKSSKDNNDEKIEEVGLNNVTEDLRKSQRTITEDQDKKTVGEQGIYGKPRVDSMHQIQYNQHMFQQQVLAQQAQQQFHANQQMKIHQVHQQSPYHQQASYHQQLAQARSQELLNGRSDEPILYQGQHSGLAQRSSSRPPTNFMQMPPHSQYVQKEMNKEDIRQPASPDRRSAQQIERDNQKFRNFEARRTASQPHLLLDDEIKTDLTDSRPQPQAAPSGMRRGSYGNIVDVLTGLDKEKENDDGGFLRRNNSKEGRLNPTKQREPEENNTSTSTNNESSYTKDSSSLSDVLQGSPRKKLEGEIGKIEGVYNVGERFKSEEVNRGIKKNPGSAASSDYDKTGGQSSSNVDSGRGSAAYSSGRRPGCTDVNSDIGDSLQMSRNSYNDIMSSGHDSEWVDVMENELRNILEPKLHDLTLHSNRDGIANSTISESISSMTPPLPPLSPGEQSSANVTPRNSGRYKHSSLPYGSKPDYDNYKTKSSTCRDPISGRWAPNTSQKPRFSKKVDHHAFRSKQIFGLDTADLTSTTTRSLDLESMLDAQSDSDGDLSTTDARAIRKQLEGLETMYSEVLKLLGVKKNTSRYQPSDPRFSKRRYGSMSSLPSSSVSSRPIRDKRRAHEERKKVRDIRGINKRFQRLESHVVTLARSVAHLSSEMRTQHLMIQEMENIRGEIAALRTQTNMLTVRSQSTSRQMNMSKDLPSLTNPTRVKKLTKFFGDEPPLLRLFLRKLGYEKYANIFEKERIGMVELPYLTEERLQKMGIPLGPRLRIMQEAQISVCKENTLCIV